MLEYWVQARRTDQVGSIAAAKNAVVLLDTSLAGRSDALNPAALMLASLAACMIKSIERIVPMLKFQLRAVEVTLHALRRDSSPKFVSIDYALTVDSERAISGLTSSTGRSASTAPSPI